MVLPADTCTVFTYAIPEEVQQLLNPDYTNESNPEVHLINLSLNILQNACDAQLGRFYKRPKNSKGQLRHVQPPLSGIPIHFLCSMAVNSSAVSSTEQGHIKVWTEGRLLLVIAAPSKESGQFLYSQSKVFIAGGRHILNVIIWH